MRRSLFAAFFLSTAGMASAQTPPPATQSQSLPRYTAAQFFSTTSVGIGGSGGITFSPDGRSILASNDASGVFNAIAIPVAGGEPVRLTNSTTNAVWTESYFPNDGRILYTQDQGGNELDHLYVRLPDGTTRDLTPGERVKANFMRWSADGRTFYVSTNERDQRFFDIYAYDTTTYERRLIFTNSGFNVAAISRDGRWVALVKSISSANNELYLAQAGASGEPRLITPHEGNVSYDVYDFTPDSRQLVFGTNQHGEWNQAWTHDLASGRQASMLAADWDVSSLSFSPSGRYRVHALNADSTTQLTITDTRTSRPVTIRDLPPGDITGVRFNRDETGIAFTLNGSTSPTDIYYADLATGAARRLTQSLSRELDQAQLVQGQVTRFRSYDGLEVPGILYRPREASAGTPVPAIVLVHGGPGGQARRTYSAMIQHLVNHGYAVFDINNRGSSGYGKTFYHLDDRRHGDADLRDVVAARDWLANMDWISDRVAVMGGSYGGYMTAAAMAFHPTTFDVGVNIFGVTNWPRTLESIPAWWAAERTALYDELGDPATDMERLRRISPLFHAERIRRPMLVVQGANDPRVLPRESEELVAGIRRNNVPVEYVVFPDEGHGFVRKANRITASEAYLRFLNQYLRR